MARDYVYDQGFAEERARLRGMESLWDPGTSPGFDFFRLSFESLRQVVVDAGLISVEDADAAAALFGEGGRIYTPVMMAGIGRR